MFSVGKKNSGTRLETNMNKAKFGSVRVTINPYRLK